MQARGLPSIRQRMDRERTGMSQATSGKRIPNAAHESHPWRIREIVADFELEDVWALPVQGGAEDFPALLELMAAADPADAESAPTRFLWQLRDHLGSLANLGRISVPADNGEDAAASGLPIPGTSETSLAGRVAAEPRGPPGGGGFWPPPLLSPLPPRRGVVP